MDDRMGESRGGKLSEEQGVKKWETKKDKSGETEFGLSVKVNVNVNVNVNDC